MYFSEIVSLTMRRGNAVTVDVEEEPRCEQIVFALQKGTLGVRWENARPNFSKILTTNKVDILMLCECASL